MKNDAAVFNRRLYLLEECAYLNTFNRLDWNEVIISISNQLGTAITPDPKIWNLENPEYKKIYEMWQDANFNNASIKWINYYPNLNFSEDVTNSVAKYLRINVHRSWISRIDPGYYAPWHWDIDEDEKEYLSKGQPKRYSIMMNPPSMGHILILGKDYIFDVPQGAIFKWYNYKNWHSGINAGLTPYYMLHILGY